MLTIVYSGHVFKAIWQLFGSLEVFLGGKGGIHPPPPKKTYNSPKQLPNCLLEIIFFDRDNELQIGAYVTETFF